MDMSIQLSLAAGETVVDAVADDGAGVVLRDFLASNYARLHRRLLRHLGCADQASDCLHDAWLRLGATTVCAVVQSPEAYVYRVACNIAVDRLRSDRLRQCAGDVGMELEQFADLSPGPAAIAEARSELGALEEAMLRLPRRHQAILADLRIDELTREEVARRYGLSLRSVDTALRQALDHCAQQTGRAAMAGVRTPRRALSLTRLRA